MFTIDSGKYFKHKPSKPHKCYAVNWNVNDLADAADPFEDRDQAYVHCKSARSRTLLTHDRTRRIGVCWTRPKPNLRSGNRVR